MTGRVLPLNASEHAAVDALLPWLVNGTLRGEELARVERHVAACEQCQNEVDWLRDVFAACAAIAPLPDARASELAILGPGGRIRPRTWRARVHDGWRSTQPWTRMLIAAQLAGIAILGTLLTLDTRDAPDYRTLGAQVQQSAAAGEAIAVIFDPAITEAELRRVVMASGGRIVDGPTATHAFVLEVPAAQTGDAVKKLRAEPMVRFAEPLGPRAGR